jgi:hypothetical protein
VPRPRVRPKPEVENESLPSSVLLKKAFAEICEDSPAQAA